MPFKSKAQQGYLFAKKPAIAKKWAKKYGVPKNLPEHKKKMKGMSTHPEVNCNEAMRRQSLPIDKIL